MRLPQRTFISASIVVACLATAAPAWAQHTGHAAVTQTSAAVKVAETEAALRDLWLGHIFWVRNVSVETLAGNNAAAVAAEKQVIANARQIADAIAPFYGKEA